MPYVTVVFNPNTVTQETVNILKQWLQPEVARVLSIVDTIPNDCHILDTTDILEIEQDILTRPEEIMVTQHATHPTDVNVPPLEIYIQAGKPKGRDAEKVVKLLATLLSDSGIVPDELLGDEQLGIFLTFHEHNGFGFVPKRN